jgi:methylenetetrahydrofolate dehydrogenase (NADP+)/methenyltetrahydrofolate cyclohydrolase/formyltetrahydrofolate synthetase
MASKIDGTAIAKSIREGLKAEIEQTQQTNPRFKPNLVIFQGKLFAADAGFTNELKANYNFDIQLAIAPIPVSSRLRSSP